jgi:exodeoxyribonuclease VII large subunit
MPETFNDRKIFALSEVTKSIQRTLAERYSSVFWVTAEMNKLNHYSHSGHCYPDLVEKKDGKVIAQLRSSLWKDDYRKANKKFLNVLKDPLKDGIKILFSATINFDPVHGLSLRIIDIDPVYSLGELEREKQDAIEKLRSEGIFERNKSATLPRVPQSIAVISVETSKGYSDYLKIIEKNPWGYKFINVLFPSLLQGDKSVSSILYQLNRIRKVVKYFDAVAIIRGGGGDVGLSSFNNYMLAREVALFPIPVITGIGHSTNETVVEMVSYKNAITPTELADFLIQKFHDFSLPVRNAEEVIVERSQRLIRDEKLKLQNLLRYFQSITQNRLLMSRHSLEGCSNAVLQESKFLLRNAHDKLHQLQAGLKTACAVTIEREKSNVRESGTELSAQVQIVLGGTKQSLQSMEKNVGILDPINVLRRGFTITLDSNGKAVRDVKELGSDQYLTTIFANGKVISKIKEINQTQNDE